LHFIKRSYSSIQDHLNVNTSCYKRERTFFTMPQEDLCSEVLATRILIPFIFIFILLSVILMVYISHRETIKIFIFAQPWGKLFFSEDNIDKEKLYDAFISYSHHDEDFVMETLLPGLENPESTNDKTYKCLIHSRDWDVGKMISDQIIQSVEDSRKTIIVLSSGYIKSMWTKLEFKAAHSKAMKEKIQRVIIILRGKKPKKESLDEDLQKYLDTNSYIPSDDPWFWKKLRYSLSKKKHKEKKKQKSDDTFREQYSKNIQLDNSSSKQNKIQWPYTKQFSKELLISDIIKNDSCTV